MSLSLASYNGDYASIYFDKESYDIGEIAKIRIVTKETLSNPSCNVSLLRFQFPVFLQGNNMFMIGQD